MSLPRRGVALFLVVAALAVAAVLSTAMLTGAALQGSAERSTVDAAAAQCLAESGVALATHYLRYPERAPALGPDGHYSGTTGLVIDPAIDGRVDIAVEKQPDETFHVAAAATVGGVERRQKAVIAVDRRYHVDSAVALGAAMTIPSTVQIEGDLESVGNVVLAAGAVLTGAATALLDNSSPDRNASVTPSWSELNLAKTLLDATPHYVLDGQVHYPDRLLVSSFVGALVTPDPTRNPANVWYTTGNLSASSLTLDGTLVVIGPTRRLILTGDCVVVAKAGMPALVVQNDLLLNSTTVNQKVRVDGLAWIGDDIAPTAGTCLGADVLIQGALMQGGGSPDPSISSLITGSIVVRYDAGKVELPDLSRAGASVSGVRVLCWDTAMETP